MVAPDPQVRIRELEAALCRAHLENELLRRALKAAEKGGLRRNGNGSDRRECRFARGTAAFRSLCGPGVGP
jgi:hypothetical protein